MIFSVLIVNLLVSVSACMALPDSEEIRNHISQMQYTPKEEELTPDTLVMDVTSISPSSITREEAEEDIDHLFYLLENGYSGYVSDG